MEHLLLKAATTATDQGTFEAVISTATPDREGDIVEPSAIADALAKWAALDKLVPLAWFHTDQVIGHIDAKSVRVEGDEVLANGWIDQNTTRGGEAWRLVKSGTLSFSYGYLLPQGGATKRADGQRGRHIKTLDIFEISVVPVLPANNDTRVLSFKALAQDGVTEDHVKAALDGEGSELTQEVKERLAAMAQQILDNTTTKSVDVTDKEPKSARSVDPLRKQARDLAREVLRGGVDPQPPTKASEEPKPEPEMDPVALRKYSRDLMVQVLSGREVT